MLKSSNPKTLNAIFEELSTKIDHDARKNIINVNRENALDGMLRGINRKSFNPLATPSVMFMNYKNTPELGIDAGGPTRECFRICMSSLCKLSCFHSYTDQQGVALKFCQKSLQEKTYESCGRIMAYVAVHGNYLPQILTQKEDIFNSDTCDLIHLWLCNITFL